MQRLQTAECFLFLVPVGQTPSAASALFSLQAHPRSNAWRQDAAGSRASLVSHPLPEMDGSQSPDELQSAGAGPNQMEDGSATETQRQPVSQEDALAALKVGFSMS